MPVLDAQHYFEQLPPDLFSDECHFTPQGYERMARLVREELVDGEGRHSKRCAIGSRPRVSERIRRQTVNRERQAEA